LFNSIFYYFSAGFAVLIYFNEQYENYTNIKLKKVLFFPI